MDLSGKITIGLSLVILLIASLSGCTRSSHDEPPVTFTLRLENVTGRDVNGTMLYDIIVSIHEMDPSDYEPLWLNIRVNLFEEETDNPMLFNYKPEKYDYVPRNEPLIFYEDLSGLPDHIELGDGFTLTGLDESYEGGVFYVFYSLKEAGALTLPEDFS